MLFSSFSGVKAAILVFNASIPGSVTVERIYKLPGTIWRNSISNCSLSWVLTSSPLLSRLKPGLPSSLGIKALTAGSPMPTINNGILRVFSSFSNFVLSPSSSSPSVIKIIARCPPSADSKARNAVSNARCRFVPCKGIESVLNSSIYWLKLDMSRVSGHSKNASPANAIKP